VQNIGYPSKLAAKQESRAGKKGEALGIIPEVRLLSRAVDAVAAEKSFVIQEIDGSVGTGKGAFIDGAPFLPPAHRNAKWALQLFQRSPRNAVVSRQDDPDIMSGPV